MSEKERKSRKDYKILIVDPNEEDLKLVSNLFHKEGVTVFSIKTMEKALQIYDSEKPSVIISEYILGKYNTGIDLVRKIRKIEESSDKTPFLFHSNIRNREILDQAIFEGVDKCYIKPLDEEGLKRLVKSAKSLIRKYRKR